MEIFFHKLRQMKRELGGGDGINFGGREPNLTMFSEFCQGKRQ